MVGQANAQRTKFHAENLTRGGAEEEESYGLRGRSTFAEAAGSGDVRLAQERTPKQDADR